MSAQPITARSAMPSRNEGRRTNLRERFTFAFREVYDLALRFHEDDMKDSFQTKKTLAVAGKNYSIASLTALEKHYPTAARLPYSLKILLENLLRTEDAETVTRDDIDALAHWNPRAAPSREIQFTPSRVLLQDFTGVPSVVDLAAMRDAMKRMGGDPKKINPLQPVELVIDHSVQVDVFGTPAAFARNAELEFARNRERYAFLGWGVGGIEAEAAMLGQPVSMLIPQVVGVRLVGRLPEGSTATDLVLRVTEMLRKHGVVGKFVEFTGPGLSELPLADRATLANMSPEYGATCGLFPLDDSTIAYLWLSGRPEWRVALVEA